jgi:phage gp29-like protein
VREDLAAADRRRISACFNRLAAVWTLYNYGADVAPPAFEFVKDEDLQKDRAERDAKLYAIGWRPKKSCIAREYEIPEEDFDIAKPPSAKEPGGAFSEDGNRSGCSCGHGKPAKQKLFSKIITALSMPKAEKLNAKDRRLMAEFRDMMLEAGQEAVDEQIESCADALGNVNNFEEARAALLAAYNKNDYGKFAALVDEVRFVAQGLGGTHGKR